MYKRQWLKYYYLIATAWGAIPGIIGTHVERGPDTPSGPTGPDPDDLTPLVSDLRLRRIDRDTVIFMSRWPRFIGSTPPRRFIGSITPAAEPPIPLNGVNAYDNNLSTSLSASQFIKSMTGTLSVQSSSGTGRVATASLDATVPPGIPRSLTAYWLQDQEEGRIGCFWLPPFDYGTGGNIIGYELEDDTSPTPRRWIWNNSCLLYTSPSPRD